MAIDYKTILNQISQYYNNLNKKQKLVSMLSVFLVVGFLVFLALYKASKDDISGYSVLFSNIPTEDTSRIIAELDKDNTPYVLKDENTILIPSSKIFKKRADIASLGLLKDKKVGFEIYDKQEFGSTDKEQEVKYKRALEGDLARSIESFDPIKNATVHIAFEKQSVFSSQKTPPSASVNINIKNGAKLSQKQILGIKSLVASAVNNLSIENVKIINQHGVLIGESIGDFSDDVVQAQMRYKSDFENNLESKIRAVLSPIVGGIEKVSPTVTIDFDFAKSTIQSEELDPNTIVISESIYEEKKEGKGDKQVGGVPGAVSNIGPVQGLEDDSNKESSSKNQSTTNYSTSKKVTNIKGAFAKIKKISAAVVLDGKYKIVDKDGKNVKEYVPFSEKELEEIKNLVARAVGYDEKRGDEISVTNMPFVDVEFGITPSQQVSNFYETYIKPFLPPVQFLIVVIVLFIFYKKTIKPFFAKMLENADVVDYAEEENKAALENIEDAEDMIEKVRTMRRKVEEQLGFTGDINQEALQYDILLEKVRAIAGEKSDEIALLLQQLLASDNNFNEGKDSQ